MQFVAVRAAEIYEFLKNNFFYAVWLRFISNQFVMTSNFFIC